MVQPTNPAVVKGLTLDSIGHALCLAAGSLYIDDRLVDIKSPALAPVPIASAGTVRLDTIFIDSHGKVGVATGKPAKNAPEPANPPADSVALAHLVVSGPAPLSDSNILPIKADGADIFFSDRPSNQKALSRTIARLKDHLPVRMMFWGDSITCGANATSPELGYASLVVKKLRTHYQDDNIAVSNLGVGGSSIPMRIDQIESQLAKYRPDVVVVEFINDLAVPQDKLEECYSRADELFRQYGAEVVYVNPFLPSPKLCGLRSFEEVFTRPYFSFVRSTTHKYGWALADAAKRWEHLKQEGLKAELLLADGVVHLNNKGHEILAQEVFKCFL